MFTVVEWRRSWCRERNDIERDAYNAVLRLNASYTNQFSFLRFDSVTAYGHIDASLEEIRSAVRSFLILDCQLLDSLTENKIKTFTKCHTILVGHNKRDWQTGEYYGFSVFDTKLFPKEEQYFENLKLPSSEIADHLTDILEGIPQKLEAVQPKAKLPEYKLPHWLIEGRTQMREAVPTEPVSQREVVLNAIKSNLHLLLTDNPCSTGFWITPQTYSMNHNRTPSVQSLTSYRSRGDKWTEGQFEFGRNKTQDKGVWAKVTERNQDVYYMSCPIESIPEAGMDS